MLAGNHHKCVLRSHMHKDLGIDGIQSHDSTVAVTDSAETIQ